MAYAKGAPKAEAITQARSNTHVADGFSVIAPTQLQKHQIARDTGDDHEQNDGERGHSNGIRSGRRHTTAVRMNAAMTSFVSRVSQRTALD